MTLSAPTSKPRIAIAFPADSVSLAATKVENTRLVGVASALVDAGAVVISAPFCDNIAEDFEARISTADLVLVWYNPFESGRDRSRLNAILKVVAAKGVQVSADARVVDAMGTKDVLYLTRHIGWGSDVERYTSAQDMQARLLQSLQRGPRVLKQLRGQSGDGVWRVSLSSQAPDQAERAMLSVRHATKGSAEQHMHLDEFVALCRPYFAHAGAMIDQAFQARLNEGMIRCYMVGNQVAGFGEQLINALYPAPAGKPDSEALMPGPRLYFPADRLDFQALKQHLEQNWIAQMCQALGVRPADLPILWDADFMLGPKASDGKDSYVLCEINISSVYPFPPSALKPLVEEALRRCRAAV